MVKIIVDTREKAPLDIAKKYPGVVFQKLDVGDYSCQHGCCLFERKEMDFFDMGRVLMQVEELRRCSAKNTYLVVNMTYKSFINNNRGNKHAKASFIHSLISRKHTPIFIEDYYAMLTMIYGVIVKNHDQKIRGYKEFNHVRHVKKKDLQLNILTSLPGVGTEKAKLLLKHFGSVKKVFSAKHEDLLKVNGFGKKGVENIMKVVR